MIYSDSLVGIEERIKKRDFKIGFIGLGRVGLPLAATLAGQGFTVLGVDINPRVVGAINSGKSPYVEENGLPELISEVVAKKLLSASNKLEDTCDCEVYIIAVPTLIRGEKPDIDAVEVVGRDIVKVVRKDCLLVLQSTVPPGTTEKVLGKFELASGLLRAGVDYGLCYSPERTQSPQVLHDLKSYPKIIGGIDKKSAFILSKIYGTFAPSIRLMKNLVAAELEKVIENTHRDVSIAFSNELSQICEIYGENVNEIIEAANSQPYSHILSPGLVGGHCIPMDPYYIISDLLDRGYYPRLIKTARDLNESMFNRIVEKVQCDDIQKVAVLGLSFKKDVKSFDTSHTLKLVDMLLKTGKQVVVHDPFITDEDFKFPTNKNIYSACTGADCLIISTAHSEYASLDLNRLHSIMNGDLVIDIRNVLNPEIAAEAGLRYYGLGNGNA